MPQNSWQCVVLSLDWVVVSVAWSADPARLARQRHPSTYSGADSQWSAQEFDRSSTLRSVAWPEGSFPDSRSRFELYSLPSLGSSRRVRSFEGSVVSGSGRSSATGDHRPTYQRPAASATEDFLKTEDDEDISPPRKNRKRQRDSDGTDSDDDRKRKVLKKVPVACHFCRGEPVL